MGKKGGGQTVSTSEVGKTRSRTGNRTWPRATSMGRRMSTTNPFLHKGHDRRGQADRPLRKKTPRGNWHDRARRQRIRDRREAEERRRGRGARRVRHAPKSLPSENQSSEPLSGVGVCGEEGP